MNEVNLLAVDLGEEVRPTIEPILLRAPVEGRAPVLAQILQVREIGSVIPRGVRDLIGPARARQAITQVFDVGVGNLDAERPHLFARHMPAKVTAGTTAATPTAVPAVGNPTVGTAAA